MLCWTQSTHKYTCNAWALFVWATWIKVAFTFENSDALIRRQDFNGLETLIV